MLAVPRSIAMSLENAPNSFGIISFPTRSHDVSFVIAVSKYHANHLRSPAVSDTDDGEPEALVCAIPWMIPERAHIRPIRTSLYRV